MAEKLFSWERFRENPVVGILRGLSTEQVLEIVPTYLGSGFFTLEITMNSPNVSATIAALAEGFPTLNVGAGTVCTMQDLIKALEAGSQFIVTPIIDEEVIEYCAKNNIPVFPGGYSPTEIYRAWSLGASAVKVFPATQLGVQYIKDVSAPLKDIKMLPTGGVSRENIRSFFEAGAIGVGMGSSLFNKEFILNRNYEALGDHLRSIKKEIRDFIQNEGAD
jgi:2-dehydro-3-deoxyphosphogluconate aldolase/(4S)-4-hydroxy-2-oxoglutarate aldolase